MASGCLFAFLALVFALGCVVALITAAVAHAGVVLALLFVGLILGAVITYHTPPRR